MGKAKILGVNKIIGVMQGQRGVPSFVIIIILPGSNVSNLISCLKYYNILSSSLLLSNSSTIYLGKNYNYYIEFNSLIQLHNYMYYAYEYTFNTLSSLFILYANTHR
jgi:hypothetical protein